MRQIYFMAGLIGCLGCGVQSASLPAVTGFLPDGFEVPVGTPIQVEFIQPVDTDALKQITVGLNGLDGLPENGAWAESDGRWETDPSGCRATFIPDRPFPAGGLVMCRVPGVEKGSRIFSFIVDNGQNYPIRIYRLPQMAIVRHENGAPHFLEFRMIVPETPNPCPVLFWVHGGGWQGGGGGSRNRSIAPEAPMEEYFSRKLGVAVASVAWRAQTDSLGTFCKMKDDIILAISHVQERAGEYGINPHRLGLCGGSAGTPASALVSQIHPDVVCYIGFNGLYNFARRTGSGSFGHGNSFEQDVPGFEQNSAALNVRENPPSTLLLHGSADTVIEPEQSVWYAQAVAAAGGEASALIYRGEKHSFFNPNKEMYIPTAFAAGNHLHRVFEELAK